MGRRLLTMAGVVALATLLAPLVFAIWISFSPDESLTPPTGRWSLQWYERFVSSREWPMALANSLVICAGAMIGSVLVGVPAAWAVVRHRFVGRRLLVTAVMLPLVVPPVVLGMGGLPLLHATGLWGSKLGLILAHSFLGLPIVFLMTRAALESIDPQLEQAARGLGAGSLTVARRVLVPLAAPGIATGAALAGVLSLNEFGMSLFLATAETSTLPRLIWANMRYNASPLVAVASCLTIVITVCVLGAGHRLIALLRHGLERPWADRGESAIH
jgi:ABC-type spermidine/putrescine transport system permease subunit II